MLEQIWGSDNHGTKLIVGIRQGIVKHYPVESAHEAYELAERLDDQKWDVYYAPAGFDPAAYHARERTPNPVTGRPQQGRAAETAAYIPGLWMDLDCGEGKLYADPQAAMGALVAWLNRHDLPRPTHVVHSGYGLHVYWLFDAAVPVDEWKDAADRFKRVAAAEKVCDDPGVIADAARILRVPGTTNHKSGGTAEVKLLHESDVRVRLDDIRDKLPALGPQRAAPRDDEWAVKPDLPPGDAQVIAERCAQMRHIRDTRGAVPEPLWRAGLSVLWRCDERDHYIHEWSKGDERYDARQTQRKAEATVGPATCQHFSELNPERCEGCPLRGAVTSPIQIQIVVEPDVPQVDSEPWRINRTLSFTITSGGVWHQSKDGETPPKRITLAPMWVVEVRERAKRGPFEADDSTLLLEWVGVDGRRKRAVARQADMYSGEGIKKWCAQENLASAILDWKLFMTFISQLTLEALKSQGASQYHETLGWYGDGFVLGDRLITAKGVEPALVQSSNPISRVSAAKGGSVEGWVAGVSVLNRDHYRLHQFVLQAGFASAMLDPANLYSAVIALVGPPGTGKTLSADAALSIYGNPQWLRQGAKSSLNATEKQLGANRHVPHLVDEITQWTPAQAGGICYMAANGQGDAKLTRTRENAPISTWRLTPFVTSNRPLTDFSQAQFTAAHRARLVELYMADPMSREHGGTLAAATGEHHYGTAAVPYLQWLVPNRKKVPELVSGALQRVTREFDIPDSHRFALWSLAVAYAAGAVAHSLKLLPWDPWKPVYEAGRQVVHQAGTILKADELARDLISEWLTEHVEQVVYWEMGSRMTQAQVRDPVARVLGDGTVALHKGRIRDLLAEHGVSRRAATELFKDVEERRLTLTSGSSPVWTYVFTEKALEFEK